MTAHRNSLLVSLAGALGLVTLSVVAWRAYLDRRFVPLVLPPVAQLEEPAFSGPVRGQAPFADREPEYDWGDEGVVGGAASDSSIADGPQFAMAGFRKPAMAQKNCVQGAVRIPRELQGFVSGPVTVKFAIGRDSSPSRFEVITNGVPDGIAASIWSAVQECKWVAGADAQGRPTAIWVILPLRFTQG